MKDIIKIHGTIIQVEPAETGYCYTLKEYKTNKQYFFFNTWKLNINQSIVYVFSLRAKAGKNKYYLLLVNCRKSINSEKEKAYKQVVNQQERVSQEKQQLKAEIKYLEGLAKNQRIEIKILRKLLDIKQREIDNKPEYQPQNIFDHLARVYYKSNPNAIEKQLLNEVDNLINGTYLGKEWMFAFRVKQNYLD